MYILTYNESPNRVCEYTADNWEDCQRVMFRLVCKGFSVTVRIV